MVARIILLLVLVLVGLFGMPGRVGAQQESCLSGSSVLIGSSYYVAYSEIASLPGVIPDPFSGFFRIQPDFEFWGDIPPIANFQRYTSSWGSLPRRTWILSLSPDHRISASSSAYFASWTFCTRQLTPTATAEPTPTATAEPTPTATDEPTPTATDEPTPTATDEPTPTATAEPTPTASASPIPTVIAVAATFNVVSDTNTFIDRVVELANDGAAEQQIMFGFAALFLGFIVIIALAAIIRGGD